MKKINVILVLFISLLVLFWKVPNAYANSHTYTVSHTKTFSQKASYKIVVRKNQITKVYGVHVHAITSEIIHGKLRVTS